VGQVIKLVISFLVGILTVRYLGPNNYGIINYVRSYVAFFTAIVGLGLNGVIIYEFVNNKNSDGSILGTAMLLRFGAGLICTIFLYLTVWVVDHGETITMIVTALQCIQLPFLCLDTINYWYQYQLKSKYSVIAQTLAYIIASGYKIFLLAAGKGVEWFAFATSLDVLILGFFYFGIWIRQHKNPLKWDLLIAKRILKGSIPFILANIMVVVYGQVDKIMIKHMLNSDSEVGLYSAAIAICGYVGFIPLAILDSARPLIVKAKNTSEEIYNIRFKQLVAGIVWTCAICSMIITFLSDNIIIILYGQEYLETGNCLKIAVWYTAFSYLGSARSFWLICEKKNKYVILFSAMGAIGNIGLNALMIPYWGKEGAALATLLTQMLANFLFPLLFRDTRRYSTLVVEAIILKNIEIKDFLKHLNKHILK